jgi:hypothetical protein
MLCKHRETGRDKMVKEGGARGARALRKGGVREERRKKRNEREREERKGRGWGKEGRSNPRHYM